MGVGVYGEVARGHMERGRGVYGEWASGWMEWAWGCMESGRGGVWRVGERVYGMWPRGCMESG